MLKVKINKTSFTSDTVELNVADIFFTDDTKSVITVVTSNPHKLRDNDEITISREDTSYFASETRSVSVLTPYSFNINAFNDIQLFVTNATIENLKFVLNENNTIEVKRALTIDLSSEHIFVVNYYPVYSTTLIEDDYYDYEEVSGIKKCVGDYLLYNGFIHQSSEINGEGKYIMDGSVHNIDYGQIKYTDRNNIEVELEDLIVPLTNDGDNDLLRLIYLVNGSDKEEETIINDIVNRFESITFYCEDRRFFIQEKIKRGDGKLHLNLLKSDDYTTVTTMTRETGHCHLFFPIASDFETNMSKQELFEENALADYQEKSLNDIVDYEKRMFYPVYVDYASYNDKKTINDDMLSSVNEIVFNLHLRERYHSEDNGWTYGESEWITDDQFDWNNYSISSNTINFKKSNITDSDADLLYYLGFDDEDVYYQKKKLQKTFLRLSFYDSRDRSSQVLQYYSTIFLDSGDLYTKYIKAKNQNRATSDSFIKDEHNGDGDDKDLRLCARFSCYDKSNMSACSEGFYLYAFPSLVKGAQLTPLYMKVELNHAKYGRTIPFTLPTVSSHWEDGYTLDDEIIRDNSRDITSEYFPIHYANNSGGINMKRLINDLYIKVYVKYDFKTNRYVWFLPPNENELVGDKLIINLFEPKINKISS